MKKLVILFVAGLMPVAISTSALASHKSKRPVVHSNPHHHYKGKDHMFRHHGDHDNYNPHHRKCGYMPSGSC